MKYNENPVFSDIATACEYLKINVPQVIPGEVSRINTLDDTRTKKAGWCKGFPDGQGAILGNHKTKQKALVFFNSLPRRMTRREVQQSERQFRQRIEDLKRKERAQHQLIARLAKQLFEASHPARPEHGYLVSKHISFLSETASVNEISRTDAQAISDEFRRQHGLEQQFFGGTGNFLVIPMLDEKMALMSVQLIDEDGRKTFLKGGKKSGLFSMPCPNVGEKPVKVIGIAEGFATAVSVSQLFGKPCACCFDAGNMPKTASTLLMAYPGIKLGIYADRDMISGTGQSAAIETLNIIPLRQRLAPCLPEFTSEEIQRFTQATKKAPSDFNDLAIIRGAL